MEPAVPNPAAPSPANAAGVPAGADHGRSCTIATLITIGIWIVVGVILAICGVPPGQKTSDPPFAVSVSLLGFAFCAGQGSAVTGFMAMKQKQNPLWILPAILGALLGVGAIFAIMGMAFVSALQQKGVHF